MGAQTGKEDHSDIERSYFMFLALLKKTTRALRCEI